MYLIKLNSRKIFKKILKLDLNTIHEESDDFKYKHSSS